MVFWHYRTVGGNDSKRPINKREERKRVTIIEHRTGSVKAARVNDESRFLDEVAS